MCFVSIKMSSIHVGKLQSPYFEYVRLGIKKYEMRVNDYKRQQMNIGDTWIFSHASVSYESIKTRITDRKVFASFEDAILDKGFKNLLPNAESLEAAIKIYNSFDEGNYERDAKILGVVCFTLELQN